MATGRPAATLVCDQLELVALHDAAIDTIHDNSLSAGKGEPRVVTAGADYPTPWTRDAAINCWSAVSVLDPGLAHDTLRSVTEPGRGGDVVAQDDQRWDQVIWALGARRHVELTGDLDFASWAAGVCTRTLALRESERDSSTGLYRGGAVMQDGISGYPFPAADSETDSSFVLDHELSHTVTCLSTNLVYAAAWDAAACLLSWTGSEGREARSRARALRASIHRCFRADRRWGYVRYADGTLANYQELLGLALLLEHGELSPGEAVRIVAGIEREPFGVPLIWPHFARFDDGRPGRHNAMLWPMAMGQWAVAAAYHGQDAELHRGLWDLVRLVLGSGGRFFEVYHPRTGEVDGGWQVGRPWDSVDAQTWSATAYLRMLYEGVVGLRPSYGAMHFRPLVPSGLGDVDLRGLRWHGRTLDVRLRGSGRRAASLSVNGRSVDPGGGIRPDMCGADHVEVDLTLSRGETGDGALDAS